MSQPPELEKIEGPLVDDLINAVSEAIANAIDKGLEPLHAAAAAAVVATDYCRANCGDDGVEHLIRAIEFRRGDPLELE